MSRDAGAEPATLSNPVLDVALDVSLDDLRRRTGTKWSRFGPDVLPVWIADMDLPVAAAVRDALAALVATSDLGYPPYPEVCGVPEAFATRAANRWSWEVDPALVHLLPNVMTGMGHAIEALSEPGDHIVITPPVYPPFHTVVPHTGRVTVEVPLDRSGRLDLGGLTEAIRGGARIVLLCHPHNPTGTVHTRDELVALGDALVEHDAWLVSDEIHAELTYPPACHVPAPMIDPALAARTVVLTSASKPFNVAGLRCALAVSGTTEVHDALGRTAELTTHTVGSLGVAATLAAWTPAGDAWQRSCLELLDANRRHLAERVARDLPGISMQRPEATYLAWLDCLAAGLDDPAAWFLEHARVALAPGHDFGGPFAGPATAGFARLNFATTREVLDLVLDRLAAALDAGPPGDEPAAP